MKCVYLFKNEPEEGCSTILSKVEGVHAIFLVRQLHTYRQGESPVFAKVGIFPARSGLPY